MGKRSKKGRDPKDRRDRKRDRLSHANNGNSSGQADHSNRMSGNDEYAAARSSLESVREALMGMKLDKSLLVGRLYYFLPLGSFTPSDVNTYRGILERVIGDEDDNGMGVFVWVVPVDPDAPPDDDRNRVAVPLNRVIRLSVPWTLRFDVGDDVVVHSNDGALGKVPVPFRRPERRRKQIDRILLTNEYR
jgi:hypothetical protein